jgi:hypothetical protein
VNIKNAAHAGQTEFAAVRLDERVLQPDCLAKYAALSSTGRCNTNLIECCYRRSSIWRKEVGRDFPQSRKKTCGSDGKMVNL